MTATVVRTVCLGRHFAMPMGAKRRNGEKFCASADNKEALVLESGVYAIAAVVTGRPGVDNVLGGGRLKSPDYFWAGYRGRGQQ